MATINLKRLFVPKPAGRHALYLRRSCRISSKLQVEAQRADAAALMARGRARIVTEFIEDEPLTRGQRPELEAAIAFCKTEGTRLILGKIGGMRAGFRWLKRLHDEGVYFMGADTPGINPRNFLDLERWVNGQRCDASKRIKRALAEAKSEGAILGGKRSNSEGLKLGPAASSASRRRKAWWKAHWTMTIIRDIQHRGVTSLTGIATRLNQMGHPAPRGGQWSPSQVRAAIKRIEG